MDTLNPLAEKLRPNSLDEFIGQEHLVGKNRPLRKMLENGRVSSMIFWGPPGTGKTTLARLIPKYIDADFVPFSAVTGGVAEIRKIVAEAKKLKFDYGKRTVLFIDEIHRFNKGQQDALLPHVEDGSIILIGATTENPGFEVNAPLISRAQVYKFKELEDKDMGKVAERTLAFYPEHSWKQDGIEFLVKIAAGDARKAINAIELVNSFAKKVDAKTVKNILQRTVPVYDKKGDNHYDTISAFIKSMRGGKPDAALHYLARMLKAGEDPIFIARRMVIFASEDIGNAKPNALVLAVSTMQGVQMIGLPEAQILLAQCATYLATCPKSIASYTGIIQAMDDIENKKITPIPLHLRNASNKIMKLFNYGKDHIRYPWLVKKDKGIEPKQEYMPEGFEDSKYYDFEGLSE